MNSPKPASLPPICATGQGILTRVVEDGSADVETAPVPLLTGSYRNSDGRSLGDSLSSVVRCEQRRGSFKNSGDSRLDKSGLPREMRAVAYLAYHSRLGITLFLFRNAKHGMIPSTRNTDT